MFLQNIGRMLLFYRCIWFMCHSLTSYLLSQLRQYPASTSSDANRALHGSSYFKAPVKNNLTKCQKKSPKGVLQKFDLKNFTKLTGKHLGCSHFLIQEQPTTCNFIKKKLQHSICFPVNFANFCRTSFSRTLLVTAFKMDIDIFFDWSSICCGNKALTKSRCLFTITERKYAKYYWKTIFVIYTTFIEKNMSFAFQINFWASSMKILRKLAAVLRIGSLNHLGSKGKKFPIRPDFFTICNFILLYLLTRTLIHLHSCNKYVNLNYTIFDKRILKYGHN